MNERTVASIIGELESRGYEILEMEVNESNMIVQVKNFGMQVRMTIPLKFIGNEA